MGVLERILINELRLFQPSQSTFSLRVPLPSLSLSLSLSLSSPPYLPPVFPPTIYSFLTSSSLSLSAVSTLSVFLQLVPFVSFSHTLSLSFDLLVPMQNPKRSFPPQHYNISTAAAHNYII